MVFLAEKSCRESSRRFIDIVTLDADTSRRCPLARPKIGELRVDLEVLRPPILPNFVKQNGFEKHFQSGMQRSSFVSPSRLSDPREHECSHCQIPGHFDETYALGSLLAII